jgi:hypothetical protein
MGHNATKVLMGSSVSSVKEIDNRKGVIGAGLAVRLSSADAISVALSDGNLLGISAGKSLSDTSRTAIFRKGLGVPVKLASGFTPTIGAQVAISDTTGEAKAYTGSGDSYVNAVYATSTKTGVFEDGTEANVALIDMPGGL